MKWNIRLYWLHVFQYNRKAKSYLRRGICAKASRVGEISKVTLIKLTVCNLVQPCSSAFNRLPDLRLHSLTTAHESMEMCCKLLWRLDTNPIKTARSENIINIQSHFAQHRRNIAVQMVQLQLVQRVREFVQRADDRRQCVVDGESRRLGHVLD